MPYNRAQETTLLIEPDHIVAAARALLGE
jgi:hypothetical protein